MAAVRNVQIVWVFLNYLDLDSWKFVRFFLPFRKCLFCIEDNVILLLFSGKAYYISSCKGDD